MAVMLSRPIGQLAARVNYRSRSSLTICVVTGVRSSSRIFRTLTTEWWQKGGGLGIVLIIALTLHCNCDERCARASAIQPIVEKKGREFKRRKHSCESKTSESHKIQSLLYQLDGNSIIFLSNTVDSDLCRSWNYISH